MLAGSETGKVYNDTPQTVHEQQILTAEKHKNFQGLRLAIDSELYSKRALYVGNKLVGYLMLNECADLKGCHVDDMEWEYL